MLARQKAKNRIASLHAASGINSRIRFVGCDRRTRDKQGRTEWAVLAVFLETAWVWTSATPKNAPTGLLSGFADQLSKTPCKIYF